MKRIIAITGHSDCGKSRSINYLRELLRENGNSLSMNPPYSGDKPETFRYNGQIICVCPGGDTAPVIEENFMYAIGKQADIIITACRTKGAPHDKVKEYANKLGVSTEWMKKSVEHYLADATQDLCNREYAKVIINLL